MSFTPCLADEWHKPEIVGKITQIYILSGKK